MKNKIVKILVEEVLLLALLILAMSVIKMIPSQKTVENNYQSDTHFRKIFEAENFKSDFIAQSNGLNRIDVLFKNPNLESRDEIEIYVLEGEKIIFHQNYTGYNFGDTSHARIDFPTVTDSLGKKYEVMIKIVKKVDGKLELGMKNNEINFIQYYAEKLSLPEALGASVADIGRIIQSQTIVLALPMLLWGIFLW